MRTNWEEEQEIRNAEMHQWDNVCKHLGGYECAECLFNLNNIHSCFYLENQEDCKKFKSKFEI